MHKGKLLGRIISFMLVITLLISSQMTVYATDSEKEATQAEKVGLKDMKSKIYKSKDGIVEEGSFIYEGKNYTFRKVDNEKGISEIIWDIDGTIETYTIDKSNDLISFEDLRKEMEKTGLNATASAYNWSYIDERIGSTVLAAQNLVSITVLASHLMDKANFKVLASATVAAAGIISCSLGARTYYFKFKYYVDLNYPADTVFRLREDSWTYSSSSRTSSSLIAESLEKVFYASIPF